MNIEEYINLYFKKYPEKKYMILKGVLSGGKINFQTAISDPTILNNFDENPVLSHSINVPHTYFIISKNKNKNNFYNFEILELNKLQLGFGISINSNFKFYLTQSKSLIGNIIVDINGSFKLIRYNNINNIVDYSDCQIISYSLFKKETGICI